MTEEPEPEEDYTNKHQHALYEAIKGAIDRTIGEWDNITCTDICGILNGVLLEYALNNFSRQEEEDQEDTD